jgi:transposase
VLVEAAWQLVRYDVRWRGVFERLAGRVGKKKAITAVARRLLSVMVAILKEGRPYAPSATPT